MMTPSPAAGDIVVRVLTAAAVVNLIGAERQYSLGKYDSLDEALKHAKQAGSRFNVDTWMTRDGRSFDSVARYRP